MSLTEALLVDFSYGGADYTFKGKGKGDEFWNALKALKSAVPREQRTYDEDAHAWTVEATPDNEYSLIRILENGRSCVETARSQMPLF